MANTVSVVATGLMVLFGWLVACTMYELHKSWIEDRKHRWSLKENNNEGNNAATLDAAQTNISITKVKSLQDKEGAAYAAKLAKWRIDHWDLSLRPTDQEYRRQTRGLPLETLDIQEQIFEALDEVGSPRVPHRCSANRVDTDLLQMRDDPRPDRPGHSPPRRIPTLSVGDDGRVRWTNEVVADETQK